MELRVVTAVSYQNISPDCEDDEKYMSCWLVSVGKLATKRQRCVGLGDYGQRLACVTLCQGIGVCAAIGT